MKYIRKSIEVDAVQWLKTDSHPDVMANVHDYTGMVYGTIHGGDVVVNLGDWVITESNGRIFPESPAEFEANYQPAPETRRSEPNVKCSHFNFNADVKVGRLESGRFTADIKINCAECGLPFRFLGLPPGLDLEGACVSVDGEEARMAIAPKGEVSSFLDGGCPVGFTIRKE